jgi:hypothetical protein
LRRRKRFLLLDSSGLDFMESLMFRDSKRPVTVELLQRLNLSAIALDAGLAARWKSIQRVVYSKRPG